MNEILLRLAGPAVVVVVELEAPTRLLSFVDQGADEQLERWIEDSPARSVAVAAALSDRAAHGGAARQRAWSRALAAEPGIVAAAEELLAKLTAAEGRAREPNASVSSIFEGVTGLVRGCERGLNRAVLDGR